MTDAVIKTLAVIDEDGSLPQQLAAVLGNQYEIHTVLGDAGAAALIADLPPAAVLLDLDLVTIDGFELLRQLTSQPTLHEVPALVLSSANDYATFEKAHRMGAAEFVSKPFDGDDLRARVEALSSGRRQRSSGRLKLGSLLVASGLITRQQLDHALELQDQEGGRLGEVIVRSGLLTEQEIVKAVADQMHIGVADLSQKSPDPAAIGLLPRDFIVRHRLMPLHADEDGALHLAMTNPLDVIAIDEVSMRTKRRVVPSICTESGFEEAVAIYFSTRGKLRDAREEGDEAWEGGPSVIDADVIELVDSLLTDAASMSASDIHLEPREDSLHVRCRIDGVLHPLREFPKQMQPGIISRLKIMGNMNIAERRLPQDGRTSFELSSGEAADLRLASIPSQYGENLTLRILEVSPLPPTLESLGLTGENRERFAGALAVPEGGIAIVGPTGSGKSTTLYTTLELTKTPERKVYTVEDPIERKISGIVQTEVKPAIGLPSRMHSVHWCVPTRTSSWSARSATWRRLRWPRTQPSPATRYSAPCIRTTHPRPSTGSWRWACPATWWLRRGDASSRSAWCAACARTAGRPRPSARSAGRSLA